MTGETDRRIAVVCRSGSLPNLSARLERWGWTPIRVETIHAVPVSIPAAPRWLRRRPVADRWVVTSRAVAEPFLLQHPEWIAALRSVPEVVAVGADTRASLQRLGIGPVRAAPRGGSRDLLASLGPVRGQTTLYLRSDRAGPDLARRLRRRGGRVLSRIVYRIVEAGRLPTVDRRRLLSVPVWVISSPSALGGFRTMLGAAAFDARVRDVRVFALGERTARAVRRAGGRGVRVPKVSTEEGLTKLLEKALGDAR